MADGKMVNLEKRKVIQIYTHSYSNYLKQEQLKDPANMPYDGGWHSRLSKNLAMWTDLYEIECWGMEKTMKEPVSFEKDHILYRIFPSLNVPYLGEVSVPMLRALNVETQKKKAILHLHGIFNNTTYLVPLLYGKHPVVVQHHGDLSLLQVYRDNMGRGLSSYANLLLYLIKMDWLLERLSLGNIDKVFVLSNAMNTYLARRVDSSKIEKLSMGINFEQFVNTGQSEARKVIGLEPGKKYVLYLGAFVRRKGIEYLVHAFKSVMGKYPDCTLLLVGYDAKNKQRIEELVGSLEMQRNVKFITDVRDNELPLYYSACDVFVLPSLNEGLPVVGIEAMASGAPFIGTNVGGVADLVEAFRSGMIVPPGDSRALTSAILSVFEVDQSMAKPDRASAMKVYSWESISKRTLDVYDDLWNIYYE